jgi:hypothetical protein
MKIIFYKAKYGTYWDKFIAWLTDGPFSHCEIVFSDGKCFSASPRHGGVRFKDINIIEERWTEIDLGDIPEEEEIINWCSTQIGKKYDYFGAIGLVIPFFPNDPETWYCSEICSTIINMTSKIHLKNNIDPNKLYRIISIKLWKT